MSTDTRTIDGDRQHLRPQVVVLDLTLLAEAGAAGRLPLARWQGRRAGVDRVGSWSGTALGVAWLTEWLERHGTDAPVPLVLSVGECVRGGMPTAGRVTLMTRSPLTGRYTDGQVGGELGARLATLADAVVLTGQLPGAPGAPGDSRAGHAWVLVLCGSRRGGEIEWRLVPAPGLRGAHVPATGRWLAEQFPRSACLYAGPAGERGVAFANLASGTSTPSYVGRGGVGAVFGRLGLKALVISSELVDEDGGENASRLLEHLSSSPRLAARSRGGSLELFDAHALRDGRAGAVSGHPGGPSTEDVESAAPSAARKGCKGCPTPCGWVFESNGERRRLHFSALAGLGPALGLEPEASLEVLGDCDRAGIDAREFAALVGCVDEARSRGFLSGSPLCHNLREIRALVVRLVEQDVGGADLARGAAHLARRYELDRFQGVRGAALQYQANLAALLGQCVSARGTDPMRSFPFLVGEGVDFDRARRTVAPLELPVGATDPLVPSGKGRIVFWHENFMAAIDSSGFCAFSAGGLLADGVLELDDLAQLVLPALLRDDALAAELFGNSSGGAAAHLHGDGDGLSKLAPGARLLAAGASVIALQRALNLAWDGDESGLGRAPSSPELEAVLARPGMLDAYRSLRGELDEVLGRLGRASILEFGDPTRTELVALGTPESEPLESAAPGMGEASGSAARAAGRVILCGLGPLRALVGEAYELELELPASREEVLQLAAERLPAASRFLWDGEVPVPAIWRSGEPLEAGSEVRDGDTLELVLALSGGAPPLHGADAR